MASLILDDQDEAAAADPGASALAQGVSEADAAAFRTQAPGLRLYRELARQSLLEPLEALLPVTRAILGQAGAWETCTQAFLAARAVRSPHYRDIAPAFLGWLAATGWGQDRWPFLLELAHSELLEVLVTRFPEGAPREGLHDHPGPGDRVVLDAAARLVSYGHAVHRVEEGQPIPETAPTHLLAFRNAAGDAQVLELTPATSALLVQAQARSVDQAAQALELPDPEAVLTLLRDLRQRGAIAGFAAASPA
jgi:hypothetical protein